LPESKIGTSTAVKEKAKEAAEGKPKAEKVVGRNIFLVTTITLIAVIAVIGALYVTQYSSLQSSYSTLLGERNAIASNYSLLQGQYSTLLGQNENLQQQYNALASDRQMLQAQYEDLLRVVALQNTTVLEDNVLVSISEGGSVSLQFAFQYVGYIQVQFSSPSNIFFTVANSDYSTESRAPIYGSATEGQIRIPVLPGSNVLQIHNDDLGPALITYSINYTN
jgi:hypothetical protein